LLAGRFVSPPGIRLVGTVGPQRRSTPQEIQRFHRIVGPLLRTRGGALMWKSLPLVRDVTIERVVPIRMGAMTSGSGPASRPDVMASRPSADT
jgi:hypothetical protein